MFEYYLLGMLISAYVHYREVEIYRHTQVKFNNTEILKNNQTNYRFNKYL